MYVCTYLGTHLVLSICRCIQFDVVHMYMHLYRFLELYVYVRTCICTGVWSCTYMYIHASVQMIGVVRICTCTVYCFSMYICI